MPTANGGASDSGLYDYIYTTTATGRVLYVGGFSYMSSSYARECGLSCFYASSNLSNGDTGVGGRLAFVFDADPLAPTVKLDHSNLTAEGGDATGLTTNIVITGSATYPDLNTVTDNPSIMEGWTHTGWYVDGKFYAIGTPVLHDTIHTAYSAWAVPQILITFMVEGKVHSTLSVPKGSVGVVYTPVMVEGVFEGWFYDLEYTDKYDSTRSLDGPTTLYAKGVPPLVFTSVPTADATITPVDHKGLFFFDATGSSGRYQVHWDFGDGNTSDEPIAYNTYTEPGRYTVKLTVTNIYGEQATSEHIVDIRDGTATDNMKWFAVGALCVIAAGLVIRRFI